MASVALDAAAPEAPALSLRALLCQLRALSSREAQLQLLERVQQHYLAQRARSSASAVVQRVGALPPVALATRGAGHVVRVGGYARRSFASFRARLHDATVGRVQRSLPYRCAEAYVRMIVADAQVARQLHRDAAHATAHSSSFISSTESGRSSLAPLPPGASTLSAIGWRTRRLVFSLAVFTGQSRRLLFRRSLRYWPIDALSLWFQLLLLYLPAADREYDAVRESLLDCLRWYEQAAVGHGMPGGTASKGSTGPFQHGELSPAALATLHGGKHPATSGRLTRIQLEGVQDSFLAELSPAESVSPVRLLPASMDALQYEYEHGRAQLQPYHDPAAYPAPYSRPRLESSSSDFFDAAADERERSPVSLAAADRSNISRRPRPQQLHLPTRHSRMPTPTDNSSDYLGSSAVSTPAFSPARSRSGGSRYASARASPHRMNDLPVAASAAVAAAGSAAAAAAASVAAPAASSFQHHLSPSRRPHGHHGRSATSLSSSLHSQFSGSSSLRGGHGASLSMSLETSHSRVLYARALDMIARAGIDLNEVSMDDSINDAQILGNEEEEAARILAAAVEEQDGADSDASTGMWDRHSASARELSFAERDSAAEDSDVDTAGRAFEHAAAVGGQLSVAELLDAEPGSSGAAGGGITTLTPEGRQRLHEEGQGVLSAPRLLLPLRLHASTRLLAPAQSMLVALHPLLSHLCTSHRVVIDVVNEELRSWNQELPLGGEAAASGELVAAAAAPASSSAEVTSTADVRAPAVHLFVHHLSASHVSVDALVSSLALLGKDRSVPLDAFFLALLVPSSLVASTNAAAAAAWTMGVLAPHAELGGPLLQAALANKHFALVAMSDDFGAAGAAAVAAAPLTRMIPVAAEGEGAAQHERLLLLADSVLHMAEQGLLQQQSSA